MVSLTEPALRGWRVFFVARHRHHLPSLLLLACSILIPLMLFAIVAGQDHFDVLHDAEREVSDTADVFEAHARNVFETHELIARMVDARLGSMSWDEIGSSQWVHEFVKEFADQYPQVVGVGLVDKDGILRSASNVFPTPPLDLSDRDYFAALRARDLGTFVGVIVQGRFDGQSTFSLARRRSSRDGSFNGIIVVRVPATYFPNFWGKTDPGSNIVAALLKTDSTLLAHVPPVFNLAIPSAAPGGDLAAESGKRTFRIVDGDGVHRLMAVRPIEPYGVYIAHGIDVRTALAPWFRHLEIYGAFFGLSTVALFMVSLQAVKRMRQWRRSVAQAIAEAEGRKLAEEHLRHAEKMEVVGQITGQFTHDFGNILAAIVLNLGPVAGRIRDDEVREAVDCAMIAAEDGQRAVRSMLAFARRSPPQTESIALDATLGRIRILLGQALGPASQIMLAIPPDTWPVKVDAVQLELAILNLTVNARDAMPSGGTLRISAANLGAERRPIGLEGDFVALSIADTGLGMEPHVVARVFEPYFTTKAIGKGTGLGLSQVHSFAKSCGGSVTLESEVGLGTRITLYLPSALEPSVAEAAGMSQPEIRDPPSAERRQRKPGRIILVVEDEDLIRRAVTRTLRGAGYRIFEAANGDEAIEVVNNHPEIELIFTDVRMPGERDGIAMITEAQRLRPKVKVLFATGHPSDALCKFPGATILTKPYHAGQMLQAIEAELAA